MSERGHQPLPAGIEEMPAGPALAAALAEVDPARVSPYDTVRLLRAQRRLLCREQARFAAAAREAALADPAEPGGRAEGSGRFLGDELRAVLCSSRTKVDELLDLAGFAHSHPEVDAAWRAGALDEARVRILATWTRALSAEHLAALLAVVVPEAGGLTLSGLIDRIAEVAVALDPLWADRTYRRARAQRRVRARRTEAGTANLSGLDLPLDDTAYSVRHIHALAARAQASGHPGLIDTVRADVLLALLRPRPAGWSDDDVVAALVADARADAAPGAEAAPGAADTDAPADTDAADPPDPGSVPPDDDPPRASRRGPRQARTELRIGLATLLGLDDRPGRLPGYGVVHAAVARDIARDHVDAEWRVVITDDDGVQTAVLVTRHRPVGYATTPSGSQRAARRRTPVGPRGLLTLCLTEHRLETLSPAAHPGWERLIADLRRQLTLWRRARAEDRAARAAELRARDAAPDGVGPGVDPDADPCADPVVGLDHLGLDAAAWWRIAARRRVRARRALGRFPSASLRRWIEARDQTCVFPPCRAAASGVEIDHTRAVALGGLTLGVNLGPLCGHDHRLKDRPGWRVDQNRPGHFVWTGPTGHRYAAAPEPPLPDLPEPRSFRTPSSSAPHETATTTPVWTNEPCPSEPPRPPPTGPTAEGRPSRAGGSPPF